MLLVLKCRQQRTADDCCHAFTISALHFIFYNHEVSVPYSSLGFMNVAGEILIVFELMTHKP